MADRETQFINVNLLNVCLKQLRRKQSGDAINGKKMCVVFFLFGFV